ncbi:MAG TPA: hypothetical protein VG755_00845 [Nannocystaceae bacterium]|nr:hypothetical protein [Nannocystaceae bacterium]
MRSTDVYEALSVYLAAVAAAASAPPGQAGLRRAQAELARLGYQNLLEAYTLELAAKEQRVELVRDDPDGEDVTPANGLRCDDPRVSAVGGGPTSRRS